MTPCDWIDDLPAMPTKMEQKDTLGNSRSQSGTQAGQDNFQPGKKNFILYGGWTKGRKGKREGRERQRKEQEEKLGRDTRSSSRSAKQDTVQVLSRSEEEKENDGLIRFHGHH